MMSVCEQVLDRIALGEPLSAEETDHAARCVDCARLTHMPRLLAATAQEPEPNPGFSARMQIGARRRIAVRRRNRIALTTFAAAAVVFAGVGVFTRPTERLTEVGAMRSLEEQEPMPRPPPPVERPATSTEKLILDLIHTSDVDRVLQDGADWDEVTRPLSPYRAVLARAGARKGAQP
jgi:hypothetical protein